MSNIGGAGRSRRFSGLWGIAQMELRLIFDFVGGFWNVGIIRVRFRAVCRITSILAKSGIRNVDSNVATAIRTIVVLAFAWLMAFVTGVSKELSSVDGHSMLFLVLSGLATGGPGCAISGRCRSGISTRSYPSISPAPY
jgi:hypothetical protein